MGSGWTLFSPYSSSSGGWDLVDVLIALVMLLTFACAVGLVAMWWRVLRPMGRVEPRCGGCRYPVHGLRALTCPECGRDFFDVGIEVRRRRMVGPFAFVVLWVLLFPLPAMLVSSVLAQIGPQMPYSEPVYDLTSSRGYTVTLFDSTEVADYWDLLFWKDPNSDAMINLSIDVPANRSHDSVVVDLDERVVYNWDSPAMLSSLDTTGIEDLLRTVGLNVAEPSIAAESAELRRILRSQTAAGLTLPVSGLFQVTDRSVTVEGPSRWFGWAVTAALIVAWALGFVLYTLIRRRRLRKPGRR